MKKKEIALLAVILFMAHSSQAQAAFWDKKSKSGSTTVSSAQPPKVVVQTAEEKRKADEERSQLDKRKQEVRNSFAEAMQEGKSLGYMDRKPTGGYVTAEDRRKSEEESAKRDSQALFLDEKSELTQEEEDELKRMAEEIRAQVRSVENVKGAVGAKTVVPTMIGAAVAQQAKVVASTPTANSEASNVGAAVSAARAASAGGGYRR